MHAVDIYGLSEVMGPGVAQECVETKDGLHIWEDHFYPEIIDPVTGEVLPDGEEGELVFTSLTKEAHAGHPLPHPRPDPAAAGHRAARMRRMEKITGRTDDMIILRGVNLFPTQIEELILRIAGAVPALPVRADPGGRMDAADRARRAPPEHARARRGRGGRRRCRRGSRTPSASPSTVERRGPGDDRALGRQDAPHRRPPAALAGKLLP